MLSEFREVWSVLGVIVSAFPSDILSVSSFVFCAIGLVGLLRSF